ncbi:hypothetical protein [Actinoplanes sp. GCM10030250]|uniref:hypothetical protein n=1 Tax=Actinoplanes sp. GCM10030250 TaxID=3273376 RepID=UPI00361E1B3D
MTTVVDQRRDLVAVRAGRREIGAYAVGPDRTVFVPAVDVTAVVLASLATITVSVVAAAAAVAVHRRSAIGAVTMGPGGWISIKRSPAPRLRAGPAARRPWWAHILRARRLVVDD